MLRWMCMTAMLLLSLGLSEGCSHRQHTTTTDAQSNGSATTRAEETPVKKPFMFNEADLPAGYPAPGPVGLVIVKDYPPTRMAMVRSQDLNGAAQNSMSRTLFNHIQEHGVPMTAPVVMGYADDARDAKGPESMAFLYADTAVGTTGQDGDVSIVDLPGLSVASIGVRGSYTDAHFEQALERIEQWLDEQQGRYEVTGPPRYLGYNSPFVPWFMRYGEVQVPVIERAVAPSENASR